LKFLSITIDKSFKPSLTSPCHSVCSFRVSRSEDQNQVPTVDKAAFAKELSAKTRSGIDARPAWVSESLFPFASRFVRIQDAQLHYVDEGAGPALLFLHGSPMWSFMFRYTIGALRARFRCIAVDMPGLGLSTAPVACGREFERNSTYYRMFLQELDLRDVTLIAHATAAPSALRMIISEQKRAAGVVITNSFAWSMRAFPSIWRFVRVVSSPPFRLLNEHLNLLPRLTTRIGRSSGRFNEAECAAILGPYRQPEARRHLGSLLYGLRAEVPFFEALRADLPKLRTTPLLLLYGIKDHGYQAGFLKQWKSVVPEASVILLQRSGHFAPEDEPETFTAALSEWLARRGARQPSASV
jgi:haloalkane dehalogenase